MLRRMVVGAAAIAFGLIGACGPNGDGDLGPRPSSSSGSSGTSGSSGSSGDVDGGSDAAGCTKTVCGGACVDTATDPKNCGLCGATCSGGSTCSGAVCRCPGTNEICDTPKGGKACDAAGRCHDDALIGAPPFGSGEPADIAVGDSYALMAYTAGKAAEVARVAFDGTTKVLQLNTGGASPLAADGADYGYSLQAAALQNANVYACAATSCAGMLPDVYGQALRIYNGSFFFRGAGGMFQRCPLSGCSGTPEDLALTPVPTGSLPVVLIRMDASGAYGLFGTSVAKWTEATNAWEPLFDATLSTTSRSFLAIDDTTVYVTGETGIFTCAKAGCGATPTMLVAAGKARGIAVRGTHVHWVTSGTPSDLMRCAKGATCTGEKIGSGFGSLLAEDETHLYFAASGTGNFPRIRRFSK